MLAVTLLSLSIWAPRVGKCPSRFVCNLPPIEGWAVAQLTTHPKRLSMLRAVQSDPELTATYFDIVAGVEPVTALYTSRLLTLL